MGFNIAIVGTGYVGLVTAACFAEMGVHVHCVDIDEEKISNLKQGIIPIYEPGLDVMVQRNIEDKRLFFHTSLASCIEEVDVIFTAVGTPSGSDGNADLSAVYAVAKEIGQHLCRYALIVGKSTVPVGTAKRVKEIIQAELDLRGEDIPFDVASNPEFLKEGSAIKDFTSPDRVIVGVDSERAKEIMTQLYRPFLLNNFRVIFMDIASAELTKYASNAMLATRISFMNEMANLCELLGADIEAVRRGMGADKRIGTAFLYPGCGYGGSCFPKDVRAIRQTALEHGMDLTILKAVDDVNNRQKEVIVEKLLRHYGDTLRDKTVAVWGLSFKPETDDMREATSVVVIARLLALGVRIRVYDPVAIPEARKHFGSRVEYADSLYSASEKADAILLLTEWKQFRMPLWQRIISSMKPNPVLIDGRNIYNKTELEQAGLIYYGIGKS
ncbi:UDP-glucose 6-dehydrogenase [Porphyromonas canoris]|uniref:UDP-glucose dehydrogenase family protein n=1 Tax=Porphyromonas canoris TaxID=36875 RepID=UPI00051E01E2|nr:UDP-glucose/GDP-mannose dehydrogenase family protein [Porphyromonas canoris]KGL52404.1 UDP-glucose 6-dehydrogenase [Porphyromonas canoris]